MQILLSSNKMIINKYLKKNSKIGFIANASELDSDRWYMEKDKKDLNNMGFNIIDIDITNESKEDIVNKFDMVDAIFIAGGNAFYLLQQLKLKDILKDLIKFANNKIYIGSSAGACIASPSIDYLEKLDDRKEAPLLDNGNAMNLIDSYILPHYKSDEEYTKMIDEIEKNYSNLNFIKLSNKQAIIVNDNNYVIVDTE